MEPPDEPMGEPEVFPADDAPAPLRTAQLRRLPCCSRQCKRYPDYTIQQAAQFAKTSAKTVTLHFLQMVINPSCGDSCMQLLPGERCSVRWAEENRAVHDEVCIQHWFAAQMSVKRPTHGKFFEKT